MLARDKSGTLRGACVQGMKSCPQRNTRHVAYDVEQSKTTPGQPLRCFCGDTGEQAKTGDQQVVRRDCVAVTCAPVHQVQCEVGEHGEHDRVQCVLYFPYEQVVAR